MIIPIGNWAIRTACQQNKAWQTQGMANLRVTVNLSARQFTEVDLTQSIIDILKETGLDPVFRLVSGMLKKAFARLKPSENPLLHSDQGWHYQHPSYRKILADRAIVQSMSRKGNCLDNAAMESFFGTLKSEFFI